MNRRTCWVALLLTCWGAVGAAEEETKFVRVVRNLRNEATALETSTVRYVKGEGIDRVTVDLIAVVHIGDRVYYRSLNEQFTQYDALLYELVAPKGTRIPKGGPESLDIMMLVGLFLDLDLQVEEIDYTAPNFVHADMSPLEIKEMLEERGEDAFTLALSTLADMKRQYNLRLRKRKKGQLKAPLFAINLPDLSFEDMFTAKRGVVFKRMLAESFTADDQLALLGSTIGRILVNDRNAAAMKVLEQQLKQGHGKLGLFYGAAHMPDFERHLRKSGFKKDRQSWDRAWDIRPKRPDMQKIIELVMKVIGALQDKQ